MPDSGIVDATAAECASRTPWHARLALDFECRAARTTLARRRHDGPLVVQKPLYPEGDALCQCIIVHPPGGIAGGDRLELEVSAGEDTAVQLTTPGAAKWYRAGGRAASARTAIRAAKGSLVEWMPQGSIAFRGARAASTLDVVLQSDAIYIGWDVVCLGRTASAEVFDQGEWRQRVDVRRDDALIWSERAVLPGASPAMKSQSGLNGAPVFGTLLAVANSFDDALLAACRRLTPASGEGVVTRLPGVLVARYRGDAIEAAQAWFIALWSLLRPALAGRDAVPPRIWNT